MFSRIIRTILVIAIIILLVNAISEFKLFPDEQDAVNNATDSVRTKAKKVSFKMKSFLSADDYDSQQIAHYLREYFGGKGPITQSGGTVLLDITVLSDGTIQQDVALAEHRIVGGGLFYHDALVAMCVRLTGKPGSNPEVSLNDLSCPSAFLNSTDHLNIDQIVTLESKKWWKFWR